jgi:hypothetical protein
MTCRCGVGVASTSYRLTLYMTNYEIKPRSDADKIRSVLTKLAKSGKVELKVVETAKMTGAERFAEYARAIVPSIFNKYQVRKVFGTNRQSGIFFGREEPALLVEGKRNDIYPHIKDGKTITIEDFLQELTKELGD